MPDPMDYIEDPALQPPTVANPEDHDDGDDFEDQGGELEFDTDPFDEGEDPEDNEGEDMPDDFQLEE